MRLTKKSDKLGYCLRNSHFRVNQCWNKLGQLEDILEKFGIEEMFQLENRLCASEVLNDLGKKTNSHSMSDFINLVEKICEIEQELGH
jgi:hypothetical protein